MSEFWLCFNCCIAEQPQPVSMNISTAFGIVKFAVQILWFCYAFLNNAIWPSSVRAEELTTGLVGTEESLF